MVLVGALPVLAACASPEDRLGAGDGQTFVYVDESFDLYPNRQEQGEAWRHQALGRELQNAGLCPSSYTIDNRDESATEGRFAGGLYRVTYQGRC